MLGTFRRETSKTRGVTCAEISKVRGGAGGRSCPSVEISVKTLAFHVSKVDSAERFQEKPLSLTVSSKRKGFVPIFRPA